MANELEHKIEDYLDNLMNEAERAEFELAMQNDKALAKQVAIVQEINHTIGLESKFQDFQQTLSQLNQQHFQTTTIEKVPKTVDIPKKEAVIRQINPRRRLFAIAAAVIALVVSAVLILNVIKSETISSDKLFASNYEPYNIGQRSGNDDLNETEKNAFENYTDGNYEVAIPNLEILVAENPTEETNLLSLGSAYLSTKQTDKAIEIFQKINDNSVNYQAAQWYLALANLQNNNTEQAKSILTELAKGERTYGIKAKGLLEEL